MEKVEIPNEVLIPAIGKLLGEGREVELRPKGNSMLPFIRSERDSVILRKLPDVAAVSELDREGSIHCELLLIKLVNVPERRGAILEASDAFCAKVMEFSREAIILQLVGESIIVDSFVDLLRDYDILEIARTGVVSLERGATTMRNITNL